jgi:hypothetical protein
VSRGWCCSLCQLYICVTRGGACSIDGLLGAVNGTNIQTAKVAMGTLDNLCANSADIKDAIREKYGITPVVALLAGCHVNGMAA